MGDDATAGYAARDEEGHEAGCHGVPDFNPDSIGGRAEHRLAPSLQAASFGDRESDGSTSPPPPGDPGPDLDETHKSSKFRGAAMRIPQVRRYHWYREMHRAQGDSAFWRERDPERNLEGRLPDDERVEVPAIWVTELYTPSTQQGLFDGIDRLGWNQGRRISGDGLLTWMTDVRAGRTAGWTRVGLVASRGSTLFTKDFSAELPDGVRAVLAEFSSISTGVTALNVCFILDETAAARVDGPLRATYQTVQSRDSRFRRRHLVPHVLWGAEIFGGYRIIDSDDQRRTAVQRTLDSIVGDCQDWVASRLPGVFASTSGDGPSSAALLVTETNLPLREDSGRVGGFAALGLSHPSAAWASEEWPNARMVLPSTVRNDNQRPVFACRRSDAFPETLGYHGSESNWTIAQRANDLVPGLLARRALTRLLGDYREALSVGRDAAASKSSHRTIGDLKRVRELVLTSALDMQTASTEIEALASDQARYAWNVMEMSSLRELGGKPNLLLENLRQSQKLQAQKVRNDLEAFVLTLSAAANFSQAISNVRIQRLVIVATILSVVVATIALFIARSTGSG